MSNQTVLVARSWKNCCWVCAARLWGMGLRWEVMSLSSLVPFCESPDLAGQQPGIGWGLGLGKPFKALTKHNTTKTYTKVIHNSYKEITIVTGTKLLCSTTTISMMLPWVHYFVYLQPFSWVWNSESKDRHFLCVILWCFPFSWNEKCTVCF